MSPVFLLSTLPLLLAFQEVRADPAKRSIQRPIESSLLRALGSTSTPAPDVGPGLVRWHPDFEAACDAAMRSRKPVLLFQLLGRFDEEFC